MKYILKRIVEIGPYVLVFVVLALVFLSLMNDQLSSPLTEQQLKDINSKVNLVGMKVVSIGKKDMFGCGSGHSYRVPLEVQNTSGTIARITYCPGSWSTPSQIKF